ncbi:hypothetical protein ANN_21618 [Periplaneta americana]|uniref:MYND-type domain-containing protein n=1 Tax=Periplaneta americana TaxID=6978 RepID=A0ABQ8S5Y6_PERAM|nr:hypothetical protein ANN_21618 [Periplaneta americana]
MAEEQSRVIDLGYIEDCASWKLESRFFPSKAGGTPAWLDPFNLPDVILCDKCNKPCIFLCQVYAPIEELVSCFHRTIFVFLCKDTQCCEYNNSANFKVFRCQLPRKNNFYSFDPPIEEEDWKPNVTPELCRLCCVCGARGGSRCSKCKTASYCSKEHQIIDWKAGHKQRCSAGVVLEENEARKEMGFLLPQFEIVTESEDCVLVDETETNSDLKTEEERLREFQKMVQQGKAGTLQGDDSVDDELQKITSSEDKQFLKFSERIKKSPEQILRYERSGEPLWISSNNIPKEGDIPCCEYCGGQRQFEFQILPQMLNYLDLDNTEKSVDWGILAVYTCSKSCDGIPAYKQEFLWKQDVSS